MNIGAPELILVLTVLLLLGLPIYALVDAIRVPDDSMYRAGTKVVWVLVIIFLGVIGAIIYLLIGRPAKSKVS